MKVEYLLDDDPAHYLYRGHPGVVVDIGPFDPFDCSVAFVGGETTSVGHQWLGQLDEAQYARRGARIVALKHPVEDQSIGVLPTPKGHHWPVPPST